MAGSLGHSPWGTHKGLEGICTYKAFMVLTVGDIEIAGGLRVRALSAQSASVGPTELRALSSRTEDLGSSPLGGALPAWAPDDHGTAHFPFAHTPACITPALLSAGLLLLCTNLPSSYPASHAIYCAVWK